MTSDLPGTINAFAGMTVTVIGDAMLDAYLVGPAYRLSPEAPVPVVDVVDRQHTPGGAANTAVNVRALGGRTRLLGVVGADEGGAALRGALRTAGVADEDLITAPGRATLAKQRILAGTQLIVRYDQGSTDALEPALERDLIERLHAAWSASDAVIVSDYGYGTITGSLIATIAELQARAPRVLAIDSKRLGAFRSLHPTIAKPNFPEVRTLLGAEHEQVPADRLDWVIAHAGAILDATGAVIAAVTLDAAGAVVLERERLPLRFPACQTTQPHPSGAGDTFISAFTLAVAAGSSTEMAGRLATAAADHVVVIEGTAPCPAADLQAAMARERTYISDRAQLCALADAYRKLGRRIVFTNGCFDILHTGHVACLTEARALGDLLIVGLNSDASVRRQKGADRPINPLDERAAMLAALRCVDHVVPFDEDTPIDLVRVVRPHVFVKGGDYEVDELPEAAVVRELGGTVHILPYVPDHSTTATVTRIRSSFATPSPAIQPQ
jgi:D-beta-D-heptose 7-phosphate kinase / D-beta-D-heptose 1-phosphate adenosyltransferase